MKSAGRFHVIILNLFFFSTLVLQYDGALGLGKFNKPSFRTISKVAILEDNEIDTQLDSERKVVTMELSPEDNNVISGSKKPERINALPIVINTWRFTEAAKTAWNTLASGGSALDAVEQGCTRCEELQCDTTVGYGGSPDENGETTLDAMIMDGETHDVGAVGCLRNVKRAISVARKVMEHTKHTLLVGELATDFAVKMGFTLETLATNDSLQMHNDWKANKCQPNFWKHVIPDPTTKCGPYRPIPSSSVSSKREESRPKIDEFNHDTIGMVVIDEFGRIASGTSSNGARNKIPGRVGDAPITGAGSYVDKEVGGAACTGDGDIMARFLPSLLTVEEMRRGATPEDAARFAISRIARYYPDFSGGIVAANLQGEIGAACHNLPNGFPFSFVLPETPDVKVDIVQCSSK